MMAKHSMVWISHLLSYWDGILQEDKVAQAKIGHPWDHHFLGGSISTPCLWYCMYWLLWVISMYCGSNHKEQTSCCGVIHIWPINMYVHGWPIWCLYTVNQKEKFPLSAKLSTWVMPLLNLIRLPSDMWCWALIGSVMHIIHSSYYSSHTYHSCGEFFIIILFGTPMLAIVWDPTTSHNLQSIWQISMC